MELVKDKVDRKQHNTEQLNMSDTPKRLKELRVADLKVELEKRGLQTSGVKAVLADRLKVALQEEGVEPEEFIFNNEEEQKNEEAKEDLEEESKEEDSDDKNEENVEEDEKVEEPVVVEEKEEVTASKEEIAISEDASDEPEKSSDGAENGDVVKNGGNEEKDMDEDSLNIMVGDEDNLFGEEEKINGAPGSPPRPENAPVKYPFTSKDTICLSSRSEKPPSENSSMRVNPDENQSIGSHDSNEGSKDGQTNKTLNGGDSKTHNKNEKEKNVESSIRNLWVSGLSSTTKAAEVKTVFSAHGKVSGAKIVTNARSSGARCFGYVTMGSPEDAARCVEKLTKTELGGNMIIVELATPETGPNRHEKKEDLKVTVHNMRSTSRDVSRREDRSRAGGSHSNHGSHHTARAGSRRSVSRRDERRSDVSRSDRQGSSRKEDSRASGPVLTFSHIKDQRRKEQEREEERRRRERERRRAEEDERKRKEAIRRQRDEEDKLRREREELKREREKLEREKQELMKFERERQRMEREKLEREKEELERLRRQQMSGRGAVDDRRGSKRQAEDRDPFHGERKRINQREDFSSDRRGAFDIGVRRTEDRSGMSNRYERSSREMMGSRDVQPSSRNVGNGRDMNLGRGGGGGGGVSRDHGSSRDYGNKDMLSGRGGSSRDLGSTRDSGRMGGSDYRSSRPSHGGSHVSGSGSRSSGLGGNHGSSHAGSSHGGNSHGGSSHVGNSHSGSTWSGNKSGGHFSGNSSSFSGNQSGVGDWNRGGGMGGNSLQNQPRNLPMSGVNLPLGGIAPFQAMATNPFLNQLSGTGLGGSSGVDRYDGYNNVKPSMMNQSRRY